MARIIECLIARGPKHGVVRHLAWDPAPDRSPALATEDGCVCVAAARVTSLTMGDRFVLLHPHAKGHQFLSALGALRAGLRSVNFDLVSQIIVMA